MSAPPGTSLVGTSDGRLVRGTPALDLVPTMPDLRIWEWAARPLYRMETDWHYAWRGPDGKLRVLFVQAGFITDLSSVPRVAWVFVSPTDLKSAAIPHDLLYGYGGLLPVGIYLVDGQPATEPWTREEADKMFARMMREQGVATWRRRAAFRAVRLFGSSNWNTATPQ